MNDRTIATIAMVGALAIAVADAPDWRFEPFAGWLGGMAGAALLGQASPAVGNAMAGLMLAAVLLRRGREVAVKVQEATQPTRSVGTARSRR